MVLMSAQLKRTVYIASGSMDGGVRRFGAPKSYTLNWRGLSTTSEMETFGPAYIDYRQAVVPNAVVVGLKRFDRVWMDTVPSDTADVLATDADFYIDGINPGAGGVATILFKRLSPDAWCRSQRS